MNRFGSSAPSSTNHHHHRAGYNRYTTYPRYNSTLHSDSEETSSTHSVRVSKLIEKIKNQQQQRQHSYVPNSDAFNYFQDRNQDRNSSELIYSRVERDGLGDGKRTIRERVNARESTPLHKTTVLLNSDSGGDSGELYNSGVGGNRGIGGLYSSRFTGNERTSPIRNERGSPVRSGGVLGARYFGQETDYEEDRYLSRRERENQAQREETRRSTLLRNSNASTAATTQQHQHSNQQQHHQHHHQVRNSSVPKIILHEEAVAEIPNGRVAGSGTRSPSRDILTTDDEFNEKSNNNKGSRFLGGFLTLKRGKKKDQVQQHKQPLQQSVAGSSVGGGTIRSATRSPTGGTRRTASYLNVPGASNRNSFGDPANDSSSSPKYYVPYHRSTPTLYESKYERDRMSSTGGSVLSNGSYVNKHVSRSMSMKAPWEPRHRVNEINYYNDSNFTKKEPEPPQQQQQQKRTNLSRSKSMPGKKLTSLIGSWVSKGTLKRQTNGNEKHQEKVTEEDHERLIERKPAKQQTGTTGKWGTLLRFGKGKKQDNRASPERPVRSKNPSSITSRGGNEYSSNRSSVSPIRVGGLPSSSSNARNSYAGGERTGTLLRGGGGAGDTYTRNKNRTNSSGSGVGGGGGGGGRGFY